MSVMFVLLYIIIILTVEITMCSILSPLVGVACVVGSDNKVLL